MKSDKLTKKVLKDLKHFIPEIRDSHARAMLRAAMEGGEMPCKLDKGVDLGTIKTKLFDALPDAYVLSVQWNNPDARYVPLRAIIVLRCLDVVLKKRCMSGFDEVPSYNRLLRYLKNFQKRLRTRELPQELQGLGFQKDKLECPKQMLKSLAKKDPEGLCSFLSDEAHAQENWQFFQTILDGMDKKQADRIVNKLLNYALYKKLDPEEPAYYTLKLFIKLTELAGKNALDMIFSAGKLTPQVKWGLLDEYVMRGDTNNTMIIIRDVLASSTYVEIYRFLPQKVASLLDWALDFLIKNVPKTQKREAMLLWWRFQPTLTRLKIVLNFLVKEEKEDLRAWASGEIRVIQGMLYRTSWEHAENSLQVLRALANDFTGMISRIKPGRSWNSYVLVTAGIVFLATGAAAGMKPEPKTNMAAVVKELDTRLYFEINLVRMAHGQKLSKILYKTISKKPPGNLVLNNSLKLLEDLLVEQVRSITSQGLRKEYPRLAELITAVMEAWILNGDFYQVERIEARLRHEFRRYRGFIRQLDEHQQSSPMFGDTEQ